MDIMTNTLSAADFLAIVADLSDASYGAPVSADMAEHPVLAGITITATVEIDDTDAFDEINDCAPYGWGTVAWCERDRDYGRDKPRPEGFDGRDSERVNIRSAVARSPRSAKWAAIRSAPSSSERQYLSEP